MDNPQEGLMSWDKRWRKTEDGRYEYRDQTIDITYIISEELYDELGETSPDDREEILFAIWSQAAEAIARSALKSK